MVEKFVSKYGYQFEQDWPVLMNVTQNNLNQTMGHQRTFHIYILISLSMRNPVKYIDGKF